MESDSPQTQRSQLAYPPRHGTRSSPFLVNEGTANDVAMFVDPRTLFRRLKIEILAPVVTFSALSIEDRYHNVPPDYRKDGVDWFAAFNPKIKRSLDIDLVHSFPHAR